MEQPDIVTPERTHAILKRYGFRFKKSLGQNFLTNAKVLGEIVAAAEIGPDDDVIEIGPGIGTLTEQLAKRAHQVLGFEIDQRLLPVLDETLAIYSNITILGADILKVDLPKVLSEHFDGQHTLKVVANLPYYITTPIMLQLIQADLPIERMTLMMQKEVAERLAADPGSKAYGSLSIGVQLKTVVQINNIVPKTAFIPEPKVDSAVISLVMRQTPLVEINDQAAFDRLIRGSFAQRRKSLWNNLQNTYGHDIATKEKLETVLESQSIPKNTRAEQLSIQQFAQLCLAITKTF